MDIELVYFLNNLPQCENYFVVADWRVFFSLQCDNSIKSTHELILPMKIELNHIPTPFIDSLIHTITV